MSIETGELNSRLKLKDRANKQQNAKSRCVSSGLGGTSVQTLAFNQQLSNHNVLSLLN